MVPLKLKAGVHTVCDSGLARYLRRVMKDRNKITWWHHRERRWVVGTWLSKSGGLVIEQGIVPTLHVDQCPRHVVEMILQSESRSTRDFFLQKRQDEQRKESNATSDAQNSADFHLEMREFLRRRSCSADNPMWVGV